MTALPPGHYKAAAFACACGGKRKGHIFTAPGCCSVVITKIEKAPAHESESLSVQPKGNEPVRGAPLLDAPGCFRVRKHNGSA